MASSDRNKGALAYLLPNNVETAGCDSAITITATGTTKRAAYLTENWYTLFNASWSFCGSSLEKAGKSIVVTGVAKKVIRTTKVEANAKLPTASVVT